MARATSNATQIPWPATRVATTKPAIDATAPTDRSMPPVSIVRVWQPARMASGTAARSIVPTQSAETMPGRASSLAMTSRSSRKRSGMSGRSRNMPRHHAAVSHAARPGSVRTASLIRGSAGSGSGCRP